MSEKHRTRSSASWRLGFARIAGELSPVLAVVAYLPGPRPGRLVLWACAVVLGLASFWEFKNSRGGEWWCVFGIIGIILGSLGLALMTLISHTPGVSEMEVPPLDYVDTPLSEVLQDLSRRAREQEFSLDFQMWDEELLSQRVTFQTTRNMPFKQLLERLCERVGCSFRPALGMVWNDIAIYREGRRQRQGDPQIWIDREGVRGLPDIGGRDDASNQEEPETGREARGEF